MEKTSELYCKGCYALGSACGICSRCQNEILDLFKEGKIDEMSDRKARDYFEAKREQVNHPVHYGGADNIYEVIKVCEAWMSRDEFIGAMKFQIWKYTARAGKKGPATEDYKKSQWYNNYLNEYLERTK